MADEKIDVSGMIELWREEIKETLSPSEQSLSAVDKAEVVTARLHERIALEMDKNPALKEAMRQGNT